MSAPSPVSLRRPPTPTRNSMRIAAIDFGSISIHMVIA
jgi:hypothetical protein